MTVDRAAETPADMPAVVIPPAPSISDPNKPAMQTMEGKMVLWVTVAIGVLTGVQQVFVQLSDTLPQYKWLASGAVFVGAILSVVLMVNKLTGGRSDVKVAQLEVDAAHALKGTTPQ